MTEDKAQKNAGGAAASKDLAAGTAPATVAVELARQVLAAQNHVYGVYHQVTDYRVVPMRRVRTGTGEEPHGPVAKTIEDVLKGLQKLRGWAERTAHASGAIPTGDIGLAQEGTAQAQAEELLYPGARGGDRWCREPGGTVPLAGEIRVGPYDQAARAERVQARANLAGPVPAELFAGHGRGQHLVPAFPAVEGTPAEPAWQAYRLLSQMNGQHWERPADSPADLAAQLDGLAAVARELDSAVAGVLGEVQRRIEAGALSGVDGERFAEAAGSILQPDLIRDPSAWPLFDEEQKDQAPLDPAEAELARLRAQIDYRSLPGRIERARRLLGGASAVLPPARGRTAESLERMARRMDGASLALVRHALGGERHMNKQIEKTRPAAYGREDGLERIAQYMHASGTVVYNAQAHLEAEHGLQV